MVLWNRSYHNHCFTVPSTVQSKANNSSHIALFTCFQEHRETVIRQLWNITTSNTGRIRHTRNYKHNVRSSLCPYNHVPSHHPTTVKAVRSKTPPQRKQISTCWLETSNSLNQRLLKTGETFYCLHKDLANTLGVWLPQDQRVCRVSSIGLCLCDQCIIAPSDTVVSTCFQHHISHPAHLYPEATLWSRYTETLLQQYRHTFHRIMSSNTPFHRHSSLFAFIVYICSLTSIPGLNLTFCYWKHNTVQFVRVIIMWSSPTEWSQ